MSNTKAKDHLLRAAMEVSPTGREQEAFAKMVREMEADLFPAKEICLALTSGIIDGLRYGNWPS